MLNLNLNLNRQSFLDLQYAFLENTEGDTKTRHESAVNMPRKKRKIRNKKPKDAQGNEIEAEPSSNQSHGSESFKTEFPTIPASQSDILPSLPDTPPSCENVPCTRQIESPA